MGDYYGPTRLQIALMQQLGHAFDGPDIGYAVTLPRVVFCGDQGSGKTSTIESLIKTKLTYDTDASTTQVVELVFNRSENPSFEITTIVDPNRVDAHGEIEQEYVNGTTSGSSFRFLASMVLEEVQHITAIRSEVIDALGEEGKLWANDVVRVTIEMPRISSITFVDTPGLMPAREGATEAEVWLKGKHQELMEAFIDNPLNIIVVVLDASKELGQPLIDAVEKREVEGDDVHYSIIRVMTKVDLLTPGSAAEAAALELARSEDWHVVRNDSVMGITDGFDSQNGAEQRFFECSAFGKLSPDRVGIAALLKRIKFKCALKAGEVAPVIRDALKATPRILDDLRPALQHLKSQMSSAHQLCIEGIEANYSDRAFRDKAFNDQVDEVIPLAYMVQKANLAFTDAMMSVGHKFDIPPALPIGGIEVIVLRDNDKYTDQDFEVPMLFTQDMSRKWATDIWELCNEIPVGRSRLPHVVAQVFRQLSIPWENIARTHIRNIFEMCQEYIHSILRHKLLPVLEERVWTILVHERLLALEKKALRKFERILQDVDTFQLRFRDHAAGAAADEDGPMLRLYRANTSGMLRPISDRHVDEALSGLSLETRLDPKQITSEEALKLGIAIYKYELYRFIRDVKNNIVFQQLIHRLSDVISPKAIRNLDLFFFTELLAESDNINERRNVLEALLRKVETAVARIRGGAHQF
ncbi:P-loop containing nucleoside triphosphate hydrolase protein [Xylaria sp. CBS 124048]|nr:P-loop containing nucleoside triphosphate hydrolase protein [Xylaria sp. CBS 124048]